jgi:hypothetical protein
MTGWTARRKLAFKRRGELIRTEVRLGGITRKQACSPDSTLSCDRAGVTAFPRV